jgi:rSAM/selenodomain-associated transferase 1
MGRLSLLSVPEPRVVVAVMARAPSAPGKTRLLGALGPTDGVGLRRALLCDTLDSVRRVERASKAVIYTPDDAGPEVRELAPPGTRLVPQRGSDLGARLHHAFVDLLRPGTVAALIVGSDLPNLPSRYIDLGIEAVERKPGQLVLGPSPDGGYYLIGLTRPEPRLFDDIPWGTDLVFERTLGRARALALRVEVLPEWYDVDSVDDLGRVMRDKDAGGPSETAAHTRAWLVAAPPEVRARVTGRGEPGTMAEWT